MPSGYEKSPDYGGHKPPSPLYIRLGALAFLAVALFYGWMSIPKARECWTLGQDEIKIVEIDGKQKATLDLRRIPKGECVTIKP